MYKKLKHARLLPVILTAIFFVASLQSSVTEAATNASLSGYAWSDNIGWVSFNCNDANSCSTSNYAVTMDGQSGNLSGYAWSDNIGWISFQTSDVAGCPQSPCGPKIDKSTGDASGWVRALANGSGWDGWMSLSGVQASGTSLSGFSWGSDVMGWVDWSLVRRISEDDPFPDLTAGTATLMPASGTTGQNVSLSATVTNIGQSAAANVPNVFQVANSGASATVAMIDAGTISTLAVGASQDIASSYTFSSAGSYNVRACANYNTSWGGSVAESNTGNNCGEWAGITISGMIPTATLWAEPQEIDMGQTSVLKWTSVNATSCMSAGGFSTGGAANNSNPGVLVGPLTETASYAITCTGEGGSVNANTVVVVNEPQADISASPNRVAKGSSAVITWSASGVQSCQVSGPGLSATTLSGSESIPIQTQSVFTITCTTNGLDKPDSVIVNVGPLFRNF